MNQGSREYIGFDCEDNLIAGQFSELGLTMWFHKSMTKRDLIEAAAIILNWLKANGLQNSVGFNYRIYVRGFGEEPTNLWADRGSRTFCKMVLQAITPAICGLVDILANNSDRRLGTGGMSLFGLAVVALGEEFGHPLIPGKVCHFPFKEAALRLLTYKEQFGEMVNKRSDEIASGLPTKPNPNFGALCVGREGLIFPAHGMAKASLKIINSTFSHLIKTGKGYIKDGKFHRNES